ncbi:DUF4238 domain-containing protein [Pseudomonas aeruginosa]|uniref:DUF4238 domain-containing protein n=1 Tax=Pseudomonas aeruginosa TaxID=287 RepID=UPI000EAF4877|nr:DUF4238 domain-containing protein [Pseudomonas aeruginosa]MBF3166321.1 DUF4238 domain-containing protein [Pseudomonas aeruginosa]MBX5506257.1 DUF4238 domain-containing protein [Pseudomonas aeruginosa]MBX5694319.1 DUF4238 domain-containing protein [Pseudomonas aeruginosa]MBX6021773.1 DUF4238 domain-containing protein [Pseudomonas aeruginosa]MCS6755887.1 DUF4238 domain-containing protein [Pseudomonas aeruginosa]
MGHIKKDNHYVPQAYLRQWAVEGKISTYRLLVPHEKCALWKSHSPSSIAKHQHLYTYFSGTEDSDEIERWLDRDFENPAIPSIAKVVREDRLHPEDWQKLFRFAVATSVRTPAGLEHFMKRQSETLPSFLNETLQASVAKYESAIKAGIKLQSTPIDDSLNKLPLKVQRVNHEDGTAVVQAKILNGRKMWIWHLRHVLTKTINRLPKYRWTILHAPNGVSWPTSDNPLVKLSINAQNQYHFDGGWATPGVELLLPLSPKHLLYTRVGSTRPPLRGTILSEQKARFFRKIILERARRYIFATDPEEIDRIRPRTVSQEWCTQEAETWANWHKQQSKEEAEYPD